jgi:hypothetical protein
MIQEYTTTTFKTRVHKINKPSDRLTCSRTSSEISGKDDLSNACPNFVFSNKNCFATLRCSKIWKIKKMPSSSYYSITTTPRIMNEPTHYLHNEPYQLTTCTRKVMHSKEVESISICQQTRYKPTNQAE